MAIRHEITLRALSPAAKAQRRTRGTISLLLAIVCGVVVYNGDFFGTKDPLKSATNSLTLGFGLQAFGYSLFCFVACLGDKAVREYRDRLGQALVSVDYAAGVLAFFGIIFVVCTFEEGWMPLAIVGILVNIAVGVYVLFTAKS